MVDAENELWDDYETACNRHRDLLLAEERSGKELKETTEAALDAYNLLMRILHTKNNQERLMEDEERVLDYVTENTLCTVQELTENTQLSSETIRPILAALQKHIGMETRDGVVVLWRRAGDTPISDEKLDEIVRLYMAKAQYIVVDECSRHVGVTASRLRKSLVRIGFPRMKKISNAGQATFYYYPHGTTSGLGARK